MASCYYEKLYSQFYPLRAARLVPGNHFYRFPFLPEKRDAVIRNHIQTDVIPDNRISLFRKEWKAVKMISRHQPSSPQWIKL